MFEGDELVTINDLAARAQVSRRTVERRITDGTLEVVKLGTRIVRVTGSSAEKWLAGDTPTDEANVA